MLSKFAVTFIWLQRASFSEIFGFVQIVYGIGLGNYSIIRRRLDAAMNVSGDQILRVNPLQNKDLFLEIVRYYIDNRIALGASLLDDNWTNFCKGFMILGKFIKDIWAIFLQIGSSLGNCFRQIRIYSNRFGQFCT